MRVPGVRRHAAGARHGPGRGRSAHPGPARGGAAAGLARRRADRTRQPLIYGRYFGLPRARCREPPTSFWSSRNLTDRADSLVEPLSGGMKRRLTIARALDQPARDPAARRADHRPRSAGPARAVGQAVPAQAAGRDAGADDALHGRGRAALRPARRHGPRPDRRRGQPAVADRAVVHPRGARAALRRGRPARARGARRGDGRTRRGAAGPAAAVRRRRRGRGRGRAPARVRPLSSLVRRSTLEDVFLRLTGRTLVD